MRKILCVLLVLASLVFVMSACGMKSTDEIANAINKTSEASSLNYTADIATEFSIGGLYEALSQYNLSPDQLTQMLNQMKITYGGSIIADRKTGNSSSKIGFSINNIMGMNIDTTMWQKIEGGNIEQIVKNPQLPGVDIQGKEYTVNKLKLDNTAQNSAQLTKIFNDFLLENSKDEKFITKVQDKHYKVHIDKDKCVKLIESVFDSVKPSAKGELSSTSISVDQLYEQVKTVIPMIVGDKGMDFELVIGDDGFIKQETVSLDLSLNVPLLAQALDLSAQGLNGIIGIKLKLDMKYSDYNSVSRIDFPEVNDTNAVFIDSSN